MVHTYSLTDATNMLYVLHMPGTILVLKRHGLCPVEYISSFNDVTNKPCNPTNSILQNFASRQKSMWIFLFGRQSCIRAFRILGLFSDSFLPRYQSVLAILIEGEISGSHGRCPQALRQASEHHFHLHASDNNSDTWPPLSQAMGNSVQLCVLKREDSRL